MFSKRHISARSRTLTRCTPALVLQTRKLRLHQSRESPFSIATQAIGLGGHHSGGSPQGGHRTRIGSGVAAGSGKAKPAAGDAKGKKQPFSWIYGDDEEIAAEADMMVLPSQRRTSDAKQ